MRAHSCFKLAVLLIAQAAAQTAHSSPGDPTPRQLAQFAVRDPARNIEWLRCSAGQIWNGTTCAGEARLFSFDEAERAASIARTEIGDRWRLPTRAELETLLCRECSSALIDARVFPHTPAASFWTTTPNWLSSSQHWSVNFRSGYATARNPQGMRHYLRLVRDTRNE